jgi:hypothetical protein
MSPVEPVTPILGFRSVEDAIGRVTGDKIAGATGSDVKLRAERKLGRSAEALAPRRPCSVFIAFGGPQGHGDSLPVAARLALRESVSVSGGGSHGPAGPGLRATNHGSRG